MKHPPCPLCGYVSAPFAQLQRRRYHRCAHCELVFMNPRDRLETAEEKAVYDQHENRPDDTGYRRFVMPLFEAVRPHLKAGASGLDFGCGAGSALTALLNEAGYPTLGYDPFYADYPDRLARFYDFVVCSEAAEHFYTPAETFALMAARLKTGGTLGVMTAFAPGAAAFKNWRYARDETHVAFYTPATFGFLAQKLGLTLMRCADNIALFQKP